MRWVRLNPHNIAEKAAAVVEHFRESVAPLLDGKAKGMIVLGSRLEAVRWQIAIRTYIKKCGYDIGTLVAFSGEIRDAASSPDPMTERSQHLNPDLKGRDIRKAFEGEEYRLLLVANKFQTGFDQPLLCGMYVDKRLAGIQAVQTLSRLNRAHDGKETTYVVDFVNEPEEILEAFKVYYATAQLADVTDPNLVYNLRTKLDAAGYYDDYEVDRVVAVEMNPNARQSDLVAAIEPVAQRILHRHKTVRERLSAAVDRGDENEIAAAKEERGEIELFKHDIGTFQRTYAFLSQIFDYGNTAVEKRFVFYKRLLPLLDFGSERDEIDLSKVVLTHHALKSQGARTLTLGDGAYLSPLTEAGGGMLRDKEKAYLAEIIAKVNDLFEGDSLTEGDRLVYVNQVIKEKMLESEMLIEQAMNNTKVQFDTSPDLLNTLRNALMDADAAHTTMSAQALGSAQKFKALLDILLGPAQLYEALRARGGQGGARP
jgi:type I restriction enzyme R subunit